MGKMDDELLLLTHKLLHATDYRGVKVLRRSRTVKEKGKKATQVVETIEAVSEALFPVTLMNFLTAYT